MEDFLTLFVNEVKVCTANRSFFSCFSPHMKKQEMTTGGRWRASERVRKNEIG